MRGAPAKALRTNIRQLSDEQLAALIKDLRFSTRLEQSVLAGAMREQKRRNKAEAKQEVKDGA